MGQGLRADVSGGDEDGRGEATCIFLIALILNFSPALLLSFFYSSYHSRETDKEAVPVHLDCNPQWLLTQSWCSVLSIWQFGLDLSVFVLNSLCGVGSKERKKIVVNLIPQILCVCAKNYNSITGL